MTTNLIGQDGRAPALGIYDPNREEPVLEISAFVNEIDGAVVIQIDTLTALSRPDAPPLRVYVNDGAVYCAGVERGDHNIHFVGDYAAELARIPQPR